MTSRTNAFCIDACTQCALACHHCSAACLAEKRVEPLVRCIALDIDCAALCELAAGAMARNSENAGLICRLCAQLCDMCAEECGKHDSEHCQACAQACRACAAECQRMQALSA